MMYIKNRNIIFIIFFVITSFCLFSSFQSKTIVNSNKSITEYEIQLTYYYPGDAYGSTTHLGSGVPLSSLKVDTNGWYHYEKDGIDYLVIAAATTYCRDASNHCGISSSRGIATSIPYYNYYDSFTLIIGNQKYNAMVLDSCGACMWGKQDTLGEKFDIFVQDSKAVKPGIYQPIIKEGGVSSDNNHAVSDYSTTYEGDISRGYIYQNQQNNALNINKNEDDDTIKNKISIIINNIFTNSSRYAIGSGANDFELVIPEGSGDALTWKQYDSNWGSIKLGSKGETIKGVGCLATSVAIQIKLSGTQINSENFNPGTWVQYLNSHGGFTGSLFNWNDASWNGIAPNWTMVKNNINLPSSKQEKINTVSQYLNQGYYPVMCVKAKCGHWVAVTGVSSDNIQIADPGSTATSAWPKYKVADTTRIAIFKKND